MFRAEAFCEGPDPDAHGDKTDDNEQGTKKLRAAAGHLGHEPSLIPQTAFRPLQFAAILGIRLPPNFIKNNVHWEMADGRWELGKKAGTASARKMKAEG